MIESAASMPARWPRSAGERIAAPPHAASTWNHSSSDRQNRARSAQGIDRARGRGPGGTDDHDRREPVAPILGDPSCEIAEVHLQIAVGRDRAQRAAPDPGHVRDLVERVMGLAR